MERTILIKASKNLARYRSEKNSVGNNNFKYLLNN